MARRGFHRTLLSLALCAVVPSAAQAQRCELQVISSLDAVRAVLEYHQDTDILQAVLTSFHEYSDGATLIAVAPAACEEGNPNVCRSLVVEGINPGEERTYWLTVLERAEEQLTVTTSGFLDAELTDALQDGVYTDVFRIASCR